MSHSPAFLELVGGEPAGGCYSVEAMRLLDARSAAAQGLTDYQLMSRAGALAFQHLLRQWPEAERLAVFCGTGNNGGDGWVVARLAHEAGFAVDVFLLGESDRIKGPAHQAYEDWQCVTGSFPQSAPEWVVRSEPAAPYDVVVDALMGIGFKQVPREQLEAVIEKINQSGVPVLALDVPSGLDADAGQTQDCVVRAHTTVTFIALKPGLLTGLARNTVGELFLESLDTPRTVYDTVPPDAICRADLDSSMLVQRRAVASHKCNFGHVLVVGGNAEMGGAAILAAGAALRGGAGLVTLATHPDSISAALARYPELMGVPLVDPSAQLPALLARASIVVIGPGLGQDAWARTCFDLAISSDCPQVIDADAINLLAADTPAIFVTEGKTRILTPHPGEAARLASVTAREIEADRLGWARRLAQQYQCTLVLKGSGTVTASADPTVTPSICIAGNSGMATGGMGDVLAGLSGALLARSSCPFSAAESAVMAHAVAGDRAWHEHGIGLLPSDVLEFLGSTLTPAGGD